MQYLVDGGARHDNRDPKVINYTQLKEWDHLDVNRAEQTRKETELRILVQAPFMIYVRTVRKGCRCLRGGQKNRD